MFTVQQNVAIRTATGSVRHIDFHQKSAIAVWSVFKRSNIFSLHTHALSMSRWTCIPANQIKTNNDCNENISMPFQRVCMCRQNIVVDLMGIAWVAKYKLCYDIISKSCYTCSQNSVRWYPMSIHFEIKKSTVHFERLQINFH